MQTSLPTNDLKNIIYDEISEKEHRAVAEELGTEALFRQFKAGRISGEDVFNSAVDIGGGLAVLPESSEKSLMNNDENAHIHVLNEIVRAAEDRFATVMTDYGSTREKSLLMNMKNSDVTVIVCGQDKKGTESIGEVLKNEDMDERRVFYVFARYIRTSRYSMSNLKHFFGMIANTNSGTIPLSPAFMDAMTGHRLIRFLRCFEVTEEDADDPYFYSEVSRSAGKILNLGRKNYKNGEDK
ncbi:MAG: hypothetical protein K6E62_14535 [Lachnospiraceae bacterium]|nr:hypothetical protein [Lachnospiraceae bacterium]